MPNVDDTDVPSNEIVKVDDEEEAVVVLDEEDKKAVSYILSLSVCCKAIKYHWTRETLKWAKEKIFFD